MKAKSPGFALLTNESEGGVVDTRLRFQAAWAASNQPARSPMRGSGFPGDSAADVGVDDALWLPDCACMLVEPASTSAAVGMTRTNRDFTESSV
ncbi:MAG: hypothetical protein AUH41_10400 [Gemmatimonadetes bacterium 13_1_40CM_66_11]|nr:MAG: hypothetical protein AUH41_10400 [Gemmatimonadetes bacterium 13_1_40CM_66_11]